MKLHNAKHIFEATLLKLWFKLTQTRFSSAHTHSPHDVNTALISVDKRLLCLHSLGNHIPEVIT